MSEPLGAEPLEFDDVVAGDRLLALVTSRDGELDAPGWDDIYRIAREALQNAFRHAKATKIEAEITYAERQLRLRIRDDGTGIDSNVAAMGR